MAIQISDHFTYGRLVRYTTPVSVMMIFTSIYGIVDGLFVSHFAGKEAFSALNLIYPLLMMMGALGFMLGTGGSALVAKTLGEGDDRRANGLFSMLVYVTIAAGAVCAVASSALVRPVGVLLGADGTLLQKAVLYGRVLSAALPFLMLQQAMQSFLTTAGKPKVGLAIIVAAGVVNIVLDALFIAGFGWGLAGAAVATALSEVVGGGVPVVYFAARNSSTLHLGRPLWSARALGKACVNGSSELVSNLAMSFVSMLYNYQLMRFLGADGVAAYGVIQYVMWILMSLLMGYAVGASPIISYHYGARHTDELKSLFRKSLVIIGAMDVGLTALAVLAARPLAMLFVGYDDAVTDLTVNALSIYSFMFLMTGFNIFGSSFFTALNNGVVSAIISFVRTLVFESAAVMLLPMVLGSQGIWYAIIVAEAASLAMTVGFWVALRKQYGYA